MSRDNRRFLRIPAVDALGAAVVRLDRRKTLSCDVLNKSSGGYGLGVPLDCADAFPPGRILVLEVDELVVQVRVSHAKADPEVDRLLVGLERIAELEDKTLSQQPQVNWFSALRSSSGHGLGGSSSMPRDLIMAILLCCSLLVFAFLPSLTDMLKGKSKQRATSSQTMFRLPWSWPSSPRVSLPKPVAGDAGAAAPAGVTPASGAASPVTPAAPARSDPRSGSLPGK